MSKRNKDNLESGSLLLGGLSLLLVILAVIIVFGYFHLGGEGGNMLYNVVFTYIGYYTVFLPILLLYTSYNLWHERLPDTSLRKSFGILLISLSIAPLLQVMDTEYSGIIGARIFNMFSAAAGYVPTIIGLLISTYAGLMLLVGRKNILNLNIASGGLSLLSRLNFIPTIVNFFMTTADDKDSEQDPLRNKNKSTELSDEDNSLRSRKNDYDDIEDEEEDLIQKKIVKKVKPAFTNVSFVPPPIDLLNGDSGKSSAGDTKSIAKGIENILYDFDIRVEMSGATVGPTVTQYRIKPPQGVPVRKILSLKDDIQLALAVSNIHIEAPIPGKPYVGIEVPNKEKQQLGLRTMFEDEGFKNSNNLTVAIGRNITNKPIFADIENMPHLLIAGATKSGKSVTVQNIIMSLLYKNSPDDLKLVVIDPKKVEFTLYKNLPHLGTPVIVDAKNAIKCLNWAINEMERRYEYFAENYAGIQNLADYNRKVYSPSLEKNKKRGDDDVPDKLPFIVIIFDEFNDFMLSYPKEITMAITSLTQKGRAAGIHLILATQRPDVKVITGTIKANIPARIALKTSSSIDSRTILDSTGAEDLLGKGDMLFMEPGEPRPVRVQAPFVSSEEIASVIKYIKDRYYDYEPTVIDYSKAKDSISAGSISRSSDEGGSQDEGDDDYVKARDYIVSTQRASASGLQSKFGWGFPKANGMIMRLEENKVVTALEGNKRQVLLKLSDLTGGADTSN
jgi:DNA segregation ATPase FtsK/SpoIIIE, S-DNA-T family